MSDQPETHPFIVCPRCKKRSYHPKDRENRYCGFCHLFHEDYEREQASKKKDSDG